MDLNSAKRQAGREKEMKVSKSEKRERERERKLTRDAKTSDSRNDLNTAS